MAEISGTCDDRFGSMVDILSSQIDSGSDLGASIAVTVEGEMVVDIWGGWADVDKTNPWARDTITNVWSTTKTMAALCALVLVERGQLDVFSPVAKYWPEFGANGKSTIEVRHIMSHTSGVSGWDQPVTAADVMDWEKSTAMLAAQAPWWEPGTVSGYHALNQGHLIGEVVRRITGKTLGTFFAEEIAEPLGADFHIGLDPSDFSRVSDVVPPPPMNIDMAAMAAMSEAAVKTFTGPLVTADIAWTPQWRQAEVPAANGHGNARSVALIQALVANRGRVGEVELLSADTIDLIFQEQSNGTDLVLGMPVRFGIGYGLPNESVAYINQGRVDGKVCFWGGWGGSIIAVDGDRRMTVAYMMNKMADGLVGNPTSDAVATAAFAAEF